MADGPLARVALRALMLFVFISLAEAPGIVFAALPYSWEIDRALALEVLWHFAPFAIGIATVLELHEHRAGFARPRLATAGTIVGALLFAVVYGGTSRPSASLDVGLSNSVRAFSLHEVWLYLVATSLALVFVLQREQSRSAEAHLQQHALQWRLARRRADGVAARTALMRLEPEVLFDTLRHARSTFRVDAQRADASLEALTTYLRAVLQTSKAGQTTFGDEIDLAVARLGLSDFAGAVAIDVSANAAARARRVTAGVLPQLLQRWAESLASSGTEQALVNVAAAIEGSSLLVRFDAPSLPPDALLETTLQQLAAAAGKAADDVMRHHGNGAFTLSFDAAA